MELPSSAQCGGGDFERIRLWNILSKRGIAKNELAKMPFLRLLIISYGNYIVRRCGAWTRWMAKALGSGISSAGHSDTMQSNPTQHELGGFGENVSAPLSEQPILFLSKGERTKYSIRVDAPVRQYSFLDCFWGFLQESLQKFFQRFHNTIFWDSSEIS